MDRLTGVRRMGNRGVRNFAVASSLAMLVAGGIGTATGAMNKCADAEGNISYQDTLCPPPSGPKAPPSGPKAAPAAPKAVPGAPSAPTAQPATEPVRFGGTRPKWAPAPRAAAELPDVLSSPAEVVELLVAAELCQRLPHFAHDHGDRVDAWKVRNASLIDDVRRDERLAPGLASRTRAARQPVGPDESGPMEAYCAKLADRFLPRLPMVVGANAPATIPAVLANSAVAGTWRLVSITDIATGNAKAPTGELYTRFYPDGTMITWTVPGSEPTRDSYTVSPGQLLVQGAPPNYGALLQVTRDSLQFRDGVGRNLLHARLPSNLEPPRKR